MGILIKAWRFLKYNAILVGLLLTLIIATVVVYIQYYGNNVAFVSEDRKFGNVIDENAQDDSTDLIKANTSDSSVLIGVQANVEMGSSSNKVCTVKDLASEIQLDLVANNLGLRESSNNCWTSDALSLCKFTEDIRIELLGTVGPNIMQDVNLENDDAVIVAAKYFLKKTMTVNLDDYTVHWTVKRVDKYITINGQIVVDDVPVIRFSNIDYQFSVSVDDGGHLVYVEVYRYLPNMQDCGIYKRLESPESIVDILENGEVNKVLRTLVYQDCSTYSCGEGGYSMLDDFSKIDFLGITIKNVYPIYVIRSDMLYPALWVDTLSVLQGGGYEQDGKKVIFWIINTLDGI